MAYSYIQDNGDIAVCNLLSSVPTGATSQLITVFPEDRLFRDAWKQGATDLEEDLVKAKLIAHDIRRNQRTLLFAPLDILATIPAQATQAETDRQVIRDADAIVQTDVDLSADTSTIRSVLSTADYL